MTFVEQCKAIPFALRHFVVFSARSGQLAAVLEGLQILEIIPHAVLLEVRKNEKFDELSNKIDVVVDAEFSSDDTLSASKACPLCQESIERE